MTGIRPPNLPNIKSISPFIAISLIFTILVGGIIRLGHVLPLDFPLNDGGPFYQMIFEIQEADFSLPHYTNYNLKQIPFAYPPLAFYIGAFLSNAFGISIFEILRLLPATISILTIPAFFLLCRKVLTTERQIMFASIGFTFLPTSFDWLIVGGGLTRSFGYLFAILTLWQVFCLCTSDDSIHIPLTILFASLTITSHPGTAWFSIYCSAMILIFHIKEKKMGLLIKAAWVALGVIILTAPWWLTIIIHHGWEVLTYPFQTETASLASFLTPFTFLFTNEPLLDILAISGFFGVVYCLNNRLYQLPVWLLSIFIFESRLGATYSVVPMALLIGVGIDQAIWPILFPSERQREAKILRALPKMVGGFLMIYVTINAYLGINYRAVSQEELGSMKWISENTPPDSQFLILSGQPQYGIDPISEWFPTLSKRTSQTTPQLHEWLPDGEFTHRAQMHAELQESFLKCEFSDVSCTLTWAEQNEIGYTHIYIPSSNPIHIPIGTLTQFKILLDDPGGIVLASRE